MSFVLKRRDFLQFTAGGVLGAASSGLTLQGISTLNAALAAEEVEVPKGPETWAQALCPMCPAGCGLRVRKIGERVVGVQGNPLHPVNRGGLCPKAIAAIQELYHPDRLRAPQANVGSRDKPQWKEISWDKALKVVGERLRKLRDAGQAHTVVLLDQNRTGLCGELLRRFMAAYGSPNYFVLPSGLSALQAAVYLQQGVTQPVAFDFENTRYLLSFGVNLLEGWGSPVSIMRAFGHWRDSSSGRQTKFVQVDTRLSVTAARADEWVAIRPGTEAALALGIAYVLITEGRYDADFVREHTFGFDDWRDAAGRTHRGFKSLVLSDYRVNDVTSMTGVPAQTILRLTREFGENRPGIAVGDRQTSTLPGIPYAAMAVHSLNALVGSIDAPGGVLVQESLAKKAGQAPQNGPLPPRINDGANAAYAGENATFLAEALAARHPYPVQALLLNEVNPVFSQPNGDAYRKAFRQVPFIVSFAPFLDESAALADLVLPVPSGFEKWQDAGSPHTFPNGVRSLSPPLLAARHQARPVADVVLSVAQALGGGVAAALPLNTYEDFLRAEVKALFSGQSGSVFGSILEESWNRLLERSGWWAPTYSTADELWNQMVQHGGWWEPIYGYREWDRVFQTPSGRFEFYSQTLADWASKRPEFLRAAGFQQNDDRAFLPHQPPLPQAPREYPLLLVPVEVLPLAAGEGAHLPYLQQIAGEQLFEHWESWLEINPETARELGIQNGDLVRVESRRAAAVVRARFYEGARPGVVYLPLGYGHTVGSQWARRGVNPLDLLEVRSEPIAGLPQTSGTYVRVSRT